MKDLVIRILLLIMAFLAPFVYIFFYGELQSLSAYWRTPIQPAFILVNAATSYFFFLTKGWQIPGFLLLLLTAFSIDSSNLLHNIFAILFFVSCAYAIHKAKRFSWLSIPYIATAVILFKSILWTEIAAIAIICVYHGLLLTEWAITLNKRKSLKND